MIKLIPFARQPTQIREHVTLRRSNVDGRRGSVIKREIICSLKKISGRLRISIEIERSVNAERIRRLIAFSLFAPNI